MCNDLTTLRCACGRRTAKVVCGKSSASAAAAAAAAAAAVAAAATTTTSDATNDTTSSTTTASPMTTQSSVAVLECDEQCIANQRKQALAEAFGFVGKDGRPPLVRGVCLFSSSSSMRIVGLVRHGVFLLFALSMPHMIA